MKDAPITSSNESAPNKRDYTFLRLPTRVNTVTAEVLADMLESKVLTGIESVFKQNTTRLSHYVHYITRDYGFEIHRHDKAVGTNDGRIPTISAYWLSQEIIAHAFEVVDARQWITRVREARTNRRKDAAKCKEIAAKRNAINRRFVDPRQNDFWGNA